MVFEGSSEVLVLITILVPPGRKDCEIPYGREDLNAGRQLLLGKAWIRQNDRRRTRQLLP
jgi:hypothetical protein